MNIPLKCLGEKITDDEMKMRGRGRSILLRNG
jgi:hypothetical protein